MAAGVAALVRHGDYHQLPAVPSAHQPFALTDEGRRQAMLGARELVATMQARGWSLCPVVDSSRMLRGWQTAEILAEIAGADCVESFDALAERGLGCAANLTVSQIEEILDADPRHPSPPPNWKADSHYRLPLQGAESLLEAGRRVAGHIGARSESLAGTGGATLVKVFVGHGAAFRHAAFHLGALAFDDIRRLSMHHGRPVFLQPETGGRWHHVAGDWKPRPENPDFRD